MAGKKSEVGRRDAKPPATLSPQAQYLGKVDSWSGFFNAVGWANGSTGQGIMGVDRRLTATYGPRATLPEHTLRALYRGDGIAKRIIELAVEAMTSQGFEIEGDPDGMVVARMEETGILKSLEELLRWSRLFGGCLGVIGADDGGGYTSPLDEQNIRSVDYLHVHNRWRVSFTASDLYTDTQHPKFGQPQFYWITTLDGRRFKVHESRTVKFDGAPVDEYTRWQNQGWGDSYLQAVVETIRQVVGAYDSAESIMDDFITAVVGINGLGELVAGGQERVAVKRLELLDKAKHVTNTRLIDSQNETFQKVASSVAGLPDLMDRFWSKLAGETGYPVTLLAGKSPAGLNATGDSDFRGFYDKMEAFQKKDLKEPIQRITKLIFLAKDYHFKGQEPENWKVKFKKLWQPTAKEQADIEKVEADTHAVYVQQGVMDEDEVRDLVRQRYNLEGDAPEPTPMDPITGLPIPPGSKPGQGGKKSEAEPGEETEEDSRGDELPADPVLARADMIGACRSLLLDTKGRRRGDAGRFLERVLVLSRSRWPTAEVATDWAKAYGFKADKMEATDLGFRFIQRDREEFVPLSEKGVSPVPGVEIVLARVKNG